MILRLAIIFSLVLYSNVSAAIIFNDNFDGYSGDPRTVNNWGWDNQTTTSFPDVTETEGLLSSRGLKVTYQAEGDTAWIGIPGDFSGIGEIYIRFYAKTDGPGTLPGQTYATSSKFCKIFGIRDGTNYANSTFSIAHGLGELKILLGDGSTESNDAQNTINLSGSTYDNQISFVAYTTDFIPNNTWTCYEFYMKYNTDGSRDGEYKVWIDGILRVHAISVKNRNDVNVRGISQIQLGGYTHGSINPWHIWYDNIVVSDRYIGTISKQYYKLGGAIVKPHEE